MKNLLFILAFIIPVVSFSQNRTFLGYTKSYIQDQFLECDEFEETDTTLTVLCEPIEACFYFNKNDICYMSLFYYSEDNTKLLEERLLKEGYIKENYTVIKTKKRHLKYTKRLGDTILFADISEAEEDIISDNDYMCIFLIQDISKDNAKNEGGN